MITTQETTVAVSGLTTVEFDRRYPFYGIRNDSSAPVYISTVNADCTAGADGVVTVAKDSSFVIANCGGTMLYLNGNGTVTVVGQYSDSNRFKVAQKGGGETVDITPTSLGYTPGAKMFYDGIYNFPPKHATNGNTWVDMVNSQTMGRYTDAAGSGLIASNHYIKQCKAPCQGYISKEEYGEQIKKAISFLNGNYNDIIKELTGKMTEAAEEMRFEQAAEYRDLIDSVRRIGERQKITNSDGEDKDVIALAMDKEDAVAQVFFIRNGKLIGREHYYLRIGEEEQKSEVLLTFMKQFYSGTPFIPREIMISEEIAEQELMEEYLSSKRGQKVRIRVPKKGSKEKMVELAERNAQIVLDQDRERIKREEGRTVGAVKEIARWLNLPSIDRIEAYDISNISGFQSVGSMIVYEKGKPKRADYRKFKIKSVEGPNDYASMKEVLSRRFLRGIQEDSGFERLPDLIMMDGGRGQVNIALEVLEEMDLAIPVCGMVKDDKHRTRGLYFRNVEIPIDRNSEGFKLITRVQDEAHRFAIEYHRLLRSKGQVHSILDDIPGIGPTRRKELMRHFQGIDDIKAATVEELSGLPGMNKKAAEQVYTFFHAPAQEENEDSSK